MKKVIIILCSVLFAIIPVSAEELSDNIVIEENAESDETAGVTTSTLNLRTGPGEEYAVIDVLDEDTEVTILNQDVQWFRIQFEDEIGYVSSSYIYVLSPSSFQDDSGSISMHRSNSENIVEALGFPSEECIEIANETLSWAPEHQIKAFINSGWTICVSEDDVDDTYANGAYGSLLGLAEYDTKTIYLDNRPEAADAALHEFGHFVDWYYGFPSYSDSFAPAYNQEGYTFCSYFDYHNGVYEERELFAEAYDIRMRRADELKEICPLIYDFMTEYVY